jgi:GTPase
MSEEQNISDRFRCGYVSIIGEPNVGKSTLMNGLLKQKISIVTAKPQTTRHRILGICSTDAYQVVFLDTPGIITPTYLLQETMMRSVSSAIEDADLLLFMIDATHQNVPPGISTRGNPAPVRSQEVLGQLQALSTPVYLVINKVDVVRKDSILPIIDSYTTTYRFKEVFPISALTRDGTEILLKAIVNELPEHPPFFPLDVVSEQNERFFVGEIIREQIFLQCREEIPYSTMVEVVEFKEREEGKWFINADIYVERESQKGIVIGKRGATLKEIGLRARQGIERFLQHPVFLELRVKVRRDWREDEQWLSRFGYGSKT